MKILIKALPFLFMALIFIFLIISGFFFYLSYQSLPNYNKNLYSSDIKSKVVIKRDSHAVPHIKGRNDKETFFFEYYDMEKYSEKPTSLKGREYTTVVEFGKDGLIFDEDEERGAE